MFANPSMEQIAPEELRALQEKRLQKQLRWAAEKSAHYREAFAERGMNGQSLKELKETGALQALPLLSAADFAGRKSFDFLTMPLSSLLRISQMRAASGEGAPFVHFATNGDIAHRIELVTRSLVRPAQCRACSRARRWRRQPHHGCPLCARVHRRGHHDAWH